MRARRSPRFGIPDPCRIPLVPANGILPPIKRETFCPEPMASLARCSVFISY
jgi:hypothetical protein